MYNPGNSEFTPGKLVLTSETNPFCFKTGFTIGSKPVLTLKSFILLFTDLGGKIFLFAILLGSRSESG